MVIVSRDENGTLQLKTLELSIMLDQIFWEARNEQEVEWLYENIIAAADMSQEDVLADMENNE